MSWPAGRFRRRPVVLRGAQLQVVEAGDPQAPPFLFLHGWPESSPAWAQVMSHAAGQAHALAIDLPGVGASAGVATDGSKSALAEVVHELIGTLGLTDVTLVGHDIGGMVAYRYLRDYSDISRAVIMNVPVPGVEPWDEFVRLPALFHFALHSIPRLPEALIQGRQEAYFDYFYSALPADPSRITAGARRSYAAAYATDDQLTAGFDWYRAFPRDVEDNRRAALGPPVVTPVLYLRGELERGGDLAAFANGFRAAGLAHVEPAIIPGAGHFTPEEAPREVWRKIAAFAGL